MRWFMQSMAVGFLALAGTSSLYSQQTTDSGQGTATAPRTSESSRTGANSQNTADGSRQRADGRVAARARGGGDRNRFPVDNNPWFTNYNLRNELHLNDDQIKRLSDIYNQARSELQGRNSSDRLSDEARSERMRELRNQFDEQFSQRASDVFRDENQRSRFNQLGLQYRGYSAFDNPRLQREMNLNETQLRQLRDLNNSWNSELETLRGTYAGDRTGTEQRFNQLRDRTRTNFEGILDDQQRTAYDEMVGNRFDFGPDAYLGATANQNNRAIGTGNQGSGIGTPQGGVPQGSGIGTPEGTNDNVGGTTPGGTGTGGTGAGTGAGTGGTGAGAGGAGGSGGSGSGGAGGGSGSGS
jgi:hypothetical protein